MVAQHLAARKLHGTVSLARYQKQLRRGRRANQVPVVEVVLQFIRCVLVRS